MLKYLLYLIIFLLLLIVYITYNKNHKKEMFIEMFTNNSQPTFIINNNTRNIVWFNQSFQIHFPNISKYESIDALKPVFLLKHIQISSKKNEWIANNTLLKNETGVVLSLTNKSDFKWWLDLPFPIAILTDHYEIEDENNHFKELIGKSQYKNNIEELRNLMEIATHNSNQEMILYSSDGVYPSRVWIIPFKTKNLIFIENRIEYIKLKNKAQESQHLQILGQLTSSIIHDFNNLLTCIYGFTEILEEKLPSDDNLDQIKTNVEQAKNLSDELLNFIKEKPIENQQIEPKKYIPKIKAMLQKLLGEKIKLEINANTSGFIRISETQLERILLNMVINSKDAMPNGGIFKINTSEQHIPTHIKVTEEKTLPPGVYYIIDVSDNGTGIAPENISKVFQSFFTTKIKGTGLGLTSCLKIAEHAGGTIKLTTSHKGTTFSIIIPLIKLSENDIKTLKKEQKTPENDIKIEEKEEKKTIILVEDEEPIRNLVKKSLQSQYIIHDFSDGKTALKAIKELDFDCLITDAVLPEIGGVQLAQATKEKNPEIKICIVSGYDLKSLSSELPPQTVYIGKPFTLKKLKETINNILQ